MKLFTYTLILLYFYIFSSCKGDSSNSAPLMVCLLRNQG